MYNESENMTEYKTEEVNLTNLEEGDKVLFNGRKKPCTVIKAKTYDSASIGLGIFKVETPRGNIRRITANTSSGSYSHLETDKRYEAYDPEKNSTSASNYFNEILRVVDD